MRIPLLLAAAALGQAQLPHSAQLDRQLFPAPVDVTVPVPPVPFPAGGKTYLVYELHVTNYNDAEIRLAGLRVRGGNATLASYTGEELAGMIRQYGERPKDMSQVGGGRHAAVLLFLSCDRAPAEVEHELSVTTHEGTVVQPCARVPVRGAPVVIGPPLRGAWNAFNGPSNDCHHRRALVAVDGRAHIGERYAIDWARTDGEGKPFNKNPADNREHYAYGAEVLAVADGRVLTVVDGVPENVAMKTEPIVPLNPRTFAGNLVVLKIAGGYCVFYAHLQPGRIRVREGDAVKRGAVLGYVGNSGLSSGPHLHFGVNDGPSLLGSEGVPYVFDRFEALTGPEAPRTRHKFELPLRDWLVIFPD